MAIIGTLESKSATLADCYHEVASLAAVIDGISTNASNFKDHCAAVFAKRWTDINDDIYLLAYQLHPGLRGKGIVAGIFPRIAAAAAAMWKNLGNGKCSTMRLMSQLMKFKHGQSPYDLPFDGEFMSPCLWWMSVADSVGSELQRLAMRLLSITPHSAACERAFSILGWIHTKSRNRMLIPRLEAMGKMYMYTACHMQLPKNQSSSHGSSSQVVQRDLSSAVSCYESELEAEDSAPSIYESEVDVTDTGTIWSSVKQCFDLSSSAFVSMHSAHVPVAHEETVAQVHRADDNDDFCVSDVVEQFVDVTGDTEHNYA